LQNYESNLEYITYGVPQGSVLGPLLFLMYMNDIQYAVPDAKLKLFADDTNLFLYNSDPINLFAAANISMSQLYGWFTVNCLSLNLSKTCYSTFGAKSKINTGLCLYVDEQEVQKKNIMLPIASDTVRLLDLRSTYRARVFQFLCATR